MSPLLRQKKVWNSAPDVVKGLIETSTDNVCNRLIYYPLVLRDKKGEGLYKTTHFGPPPKKKKWVKNFAPIEVKNLIKT